MYLSAYSSFVYHFIHPFVYSFLLSFIQNHRPIPNRSSFDWLPEALLQFPSPAWCLNNTSIMSTPWLGPHVNMKSSTEQQTDTLRENLGPGHSSTAQFPVVIFPTPVVTPIFTMCNVIVHICTPFFESFKVGQSFLRIPTAIWHSSL